MILNVYKDFWTLLKIVRVNILFFTWDRVRFFSSDNAFRDHFFVLNGLKQKWFFSSFLNSLGVRKDLFVIEYPHPMCFSAGGQWRFSKNSHAGIFMSRGLFDLDPAAYSFLFKHEVSHVLKNDVFFKAIVSLLSAVLLGVVSVKIFMHWSAMGTAFLQALFVFIGALPVCFVWIGSLWMRLAEISADRFAAKHSSVEELQGAICYFKAVKSYNADLSKRFPQIFKSNGELVRGFHYPTIQSRIEFLEKEILKKGAAAFNPSNDQILSHIKLLKQNDELQAHLIASLQGS